MSPPIAMSSSSGSNSVRKRPQGVASVNGKKSGGKQRVAKFLAGDLQNSENVDSRSKASSEAGEDPVESSSPPAPGETTEICFICAEPVKYSAVSPCNHRSCHVCALRMRYLYRTDACVHCRTIQPKIIFTIDNQKKYEDYLPSDIVCTDEKLGIDFDRREIMEDTKRLMKFNCPDRSCNTVCAGWSDLRKHVSDMHHKVMCQLCTRNKKVFIQEHKLYTQKELQKHERTGDEDGFEGHPACQFCKTRFYSGDELKVHYREKHERCHICDKHLVGSAEPRYFLNYDALESHFRTEHFLCPTSACLEKKFVVFETDIELRAHEVSEHREIFGSSRSARTLDANTFGFSEAGTASRRNNRGGSSSNGSNQRPNRAQQQHQQHQIQLVQRNGIAARAHGGNSEFSELSQDFAAPGRAATDGSDNDEGAEENPSLAAFRRQRLDERAAQHVSRTSWQYKSFLALNKTFAESNISGKDLVSGYAGLFDLDISELSLLVHDFADCFRGKDHDKQIDLKNALSEWRLKNESFPDLATSKSKSSWKAPPSAGLVRHIGTKPSNTGSVWSGGASSSSTSSSRLNLDDMPPLSSLSVGISSSNTPSYSSSASSLPVVGAQRHVYQMSRRPASPPLAIPRAPAASASSSFSSAWVPSSQISGAAQQPTKLSFASHKPSLAASSDWGSATPSSRNSFANNLSDFPALPAMNKKKSASVAASRNRGSASSSGSSTPSSASGWASTLTNSDATEVRESSPFAAAVKKKGKKGTIVISLS
ncbi:uncharacterized protein V1518DRAFT_408779 [Limtongia smithiae]|uniref:uncharacterized protein n=1 Tax=Limtongia smithiae TaxID=1125753 RepID=UPI0034CDF73B